MRQSSSQSNVDKFPEAGSFALRADIENPGTKPRVREQVLIVDGDAGACQRLRTLLERHGMSVRCFHSAQSLLNTEFGDEVACLVIEVELPDMDGIELLEQLHHGGSSVSAIVVADGGDVPTAVRAIRAKAVDFFEKPVVEGLLLKCIRQVIAHHNRME